MKKFKQRIIMSCLFATLIFGAITVCASNNWTANDFYVNVFGQDWPIPAIFNMTTLDDVFSVFGEISKYDTWMGADTYFYDNGAIGFNVEHMGDKLLPTFDARAQNTTLNGRSLNMNRDDIINMFGIPFSEGEDMSGHFGYTISYSMNGFNLVFEFREDNFPTTDQTASIVRFSRNENYSSQLVQPPIAPLPNPESNQKTEANLALCIIFLTLIFWLITK